MYTADGLSSAEPTDQIVCVIDEKQGVVNAVFLS